MSFLNMASALLGGGQQGNANMVNAVLGVIHNHPGGLTGLVQSFEQHGLGGAVNSWIGNGPNQPISGQQVQQVLGDQPVNNVASQMGTNSDVASRLIAHVLPEVVDRLTPNGQMPAPGTNLVGMGEALLSDLFRK